ncbi:MAG: protein-L-isoaspartate(D-aspartate) O-methyltransferase [Planctomycetota bacterium]
MRGQNYIIAIVTVVVGTVLICFLAYHRMAGTTPDSEEKEGIMRPVDGSDSDEVEDKASGEETEEESEKNRDEADEEQWQPPRFSERRTERHRMVEEQIAGRGVTDEDVLKAMRNVPRHSFVPSGQESAAYADRPLPIGHGQTISQPYIVATMSERLELEPGDRVLEIGTGSGYHAAVLAEITSNIYTIEIVDELARRAEETFESLGYDVIEVKNDDGYYGWEEHAPFDAIIVTAAPGHIPPPLMDQLKPEGRMIIPVGGSYDVQYLMLVTKDEEGSTSTRQLMPVRFVPMTGAAEDK